MDWDRPISVALIALTVKGGSPLFLLSPEKSVVLFDREELMSDKQNI